MGGARQDDRAATTPIWRVPKEDEKIRFRDIVAQPRKIISSPTWSGIESEKVCYNAGYTNVHELIPWRTLTGRQQLYQDHLWMRAFGEALVTWRPPVDTKGTAAVKGKHGNGNPEIVLNFITPHQKWGIHSTYTDNLLMLTLSRGGPCIWISETDAKQVGIADNDWVEAYNTNGALVARAVVSQRVNPGMVMMYHAQEKIVNMPGSEVTGQRGGIHNSVTRVVLKPTHMIGGYAQQSYGFNYYGTVGSNRDEFIIIRRMNKVDWLDGSAHRHPRRRRPCHESPRADRDGAEPRQMHRLPHLLGHLQECVDQPRGHGIRLVQQCRDQAWRRLSRRIGRTRSAGRAAGRAGSNGKIEPRIGGKWRILSNIFANPDLPEIDDYYEPFTFDYAHLQTAPEGKVMPTARPRSLITGERMEKIEWGPNWEEILGGEFANRSKDSNFEGVQKEIYGAFENTFMMYLPRLCEHCLNPACAAVCPSGAIYKREEDGIVLIDQDKCRGWRMCVSGCPYKKIYYNWSSGKSEKCTFCYPRIEAGQPTVCSETCVGRIRYLGVILYDADRIAGGRLGAGRGRSLRGAAQGLPRSATIRAVQAQARLDGISEAWLEAARQSPIWKMAMDWKIAFPLHPEYRTLPMVWYVPPLSPIQAAAAKGDLGTIGGMPDVKSLRIPVEYLANLLTAGRTEPVTAWPWSGCWRCAPICGPRRSTA